MPTSLLRQCADSRVKAAELEQLRLETRSESKRLFCQLLPETPVVVFGSLIKPGHFSAYLDFDIGLEARDQGDVDLPLKPQ